MQAVKAVESHKNGIILTQGVTTIGRGKSNTMVLPFSTVSLVHAKIITFNKTGYIQDHDSTNGTFVNGKRVHQQILREGDLVNIGTYSFTVAGFE